MTRARLSLWLPPIIYMAAIFHFSSESQPLPALTEVVWDKLLHLTEYAGLAVLWCRALRGEGFDWSRAVVGTVIAVVAYGASDEWHQSFVPLRDSSVRDLLADAIGGVVGALAYRLASRIARRH